MNESKAIQGSPQWAKWRASGAIGNMESSIFRRNSAVENQGPTNAENAYKVRNHDVLAFHIVLSRVDAHIQAAKRTGFAVRVVAEPGQTFFIKDHHYLDSGIDIHNSKIMEYPVREGYRGIEIEAPEGQESFSPFWKVMNKIAPLKDANL